jgi:hypothetical protein
MSGNWAMVTLSARSSFKDLVFSVDGEERQLVTGARRDRLRSVEVEFFGVGRLVIDEDHIGGHRGLLFG